MMNKKVLQFAAMFMIELILFMPFYVSDVFAQDNHETTFDTTPPFINTTVPETFSRLKMHIEGSTEPYTNLKLYVNGEYKRQLGASSTGSSGDFLFRDVALENMKTNSINLIAEDSSGNINEKNSVVYVDADQPVVNISGIPKSSREDRLLIQGTVDEQVQVDFYVHVESDESAETPAPVQSLHSDPESLNPNSVTIAWVDSQDEDVREYLIYRDDKLIASVAGTPFIDPLVSSNTTYTYKVSALSRYCVESPKTSVVVTTPAGGQQISVEPEEIDKECESEKPQQTTNIDAGRFEQYIDLYSGLNRITINFTDKAGNQVIFRNSTFVDTEPPRIIETNIRNLDPSYVRTVTVKGTVNENSSVYVYLNNETDPEASVRTREDGTFEADIDLQRTLSLETYEETGAQVVTGETGRAWINYLNITAVDDSGQAVSKLEEITFALCGQGSDWDIDVGEVTPDVLLPRYIMEGMGEIGFDVKLRWQGTGNPDDATISNIALEKMPLNREQQEDYDLDWIRSLPQAIHDNDYLNAYFLINLKSPGTSGNTTLEKENNISDHRVGECRIPEMGCVKLPLVLRVDYSFYDPYNSTDIERTQKQCIDLKVMIDRRVPPDMLPTSFLETSIGALNTTIHFIDKLLVPVKTARKWVFLACAGSWVWWWIKRAGEWTSCVGTKEIETCDPDGSGENSERCASCLKAKSETINFWIKSQWLCDRIMCPPAPTIQKYVTDMQPVDGESQRSHCSAEQVSDIKFNALKADGGQEEYNDFIDPENMNLYVRPDAMSGTAGAPDDDLCEYEYYMNYNTVALFMNELEESYCVSNPSGEPVPGKEKFVEGIDCGGVGKVLRVIGGVCTSPESINMTLAVRDGTITKNYYIESEGEKRYAYRAIRSREQQTITEAGRTVKRDVTIFRHIGNAVLTSDDCAQDNQAISYEDSPKSRGESYSNDVISNNPGLLQQEKVPEEVWSAVCQPPKEYVVDPTSGLVTAFQSVCLTAMTEYLQHWRTVLMMVKNCLETILYTGDGSAGICKQVLTIYLCDLIYFAIQCVKEKAAKGYSDEREVGGGIGGFLSYMQDSSSKMQQGIRGRYGSTSVYRTLFVERKLIHSVCAFAFTGDWTLDLDAFLEEEIEVPIQTTCFATATRRFLTKDPTNQGRAKFMYHVGGFIVSGAKDLTYQVELVCSGSNTCSQDIDPSGACDCLKNGKGEQTYNVNIGPGHLGQGEVVDEETFAQIVDPYRYDHVRILVSYTDINDNRIVNEECGKSRIVEVGGSPPADCRFDLADLSYHCEFEWGDHGSAQFQGPVEFRNEEAEFFDGDKLYIDGEIEKLEKSSEVNENMALVYKIYRTSSPNTFYKNAYIVFSESSPAIDSLFTRPLQIKADAENDVSSPKSFEFNPFVDISKNTELQIYGKESMVDVKPISSILTNDIRRTEPIKIIVHKQGDIESEGCELDKNSLATGEAKCVVEGISGNRYIFRITRLKDISKDLEVRIYPPRTQTTSLPKEVADMTLELSLHYLKEDGTINPSPISHDGARQVVKLPFTAYADEKEQIIQREGRCRNTGGFNPNPDRCYCDPAAPAGEYDCGTDNDHRFCYQNSLNNWICTAIPKCTTSNTNLCDCNLDGKYEAAVDCDGDNLKYCYQEDGGQLECHSEAQNFKPELQEIKYYKTSSKEEEFSGSLTRGVSVYTVVQLYDEDGVDSVNFAGKDLAQKTEGTVSVWESIITVPDNSGRTQIIANDTKGKELDQTVDLAVGAVVSGRPITPITVGFDQFAAALRKKETGSAKLADCDYLKGLTIGQARTVAGPGISQSATHAAGYYQFLPSTAYSLIQDSPSGSYTYLSQDEIEKKLLCDAEFNNYVMQIQYSKLYAAFDGNPLLMAAAHYNNIQDITAGLEKVYPGREDYSGIDFYEFVDSRPDYGGTNADWLTSPQSPGPSIYSYVQDFENLLAKS